jgi:hypothetical protein
MTKIKCIHQVIGTQCEICSKKLAEFDGIRTQGRLEGYKNYLIRNENSKWETVRQVKNG